MKRTVQGLRWLLLAASVASFYSCRALREPSVRSAADVLAVVAAAPVEDPGVRGDRVRRQRAHELRDCGLLSPGAYAGIMPELRSLWVRDPQLHLRRLLGIVAASPEMAQDPLDVLLPILTQESRGRVYQISPAGAAGLWQLMPEDYVRSCRRLGVTPGRLYEDPAYLSAYGAARGTYYSKKVLSDLIHLLERYEAGASPDESLRLLVDVKRRHREAIAFVNETYEFLGIDSGLLVRHAPEFERNEMEIAAADAFFAGCEPSRLEAAGHREHLRRLFEYEKTRQARDFRIASGMLIAARDRLLLRQAGSLYRARERNLEFAAALAELDARFGLDTDRVAVAHLASKEDILLAWGDDPSDRKTFVAALMRLYNGGEFNEEGRRLGLHQAMDETEAYVVQTLRLGKKLRTLTGGPAPPIGS